MLRRPPRSTRTDTLFPYTTLFLSQPHGDPVELLLSGNGRVLRFRAEALRGPIARAELQHHVLAARNLDSWPRPAWHGDAQSFGQCDAPQWRSEEHTSELQSLMRISYAVFCLKKKIIN